MGTRSITTIIDNQWGESSKLMTMYRQFDGYPSGHGKELHEFLHPLRVCNGIGRNQSMGSWANGAWCLAAQMVRHFKTEIGNIYIVEPRTKLDGEDYGYEITVQENLDINVVVRTHRKKIFEGNVFEFGKFCNKES